MSTGRKEILAGIRKSLGRDPLDELQKAELDARLQSPTRGVIPSRVNHGHARLVDIFVEYAKSVDVTVDRVEAPASVPGAVADYLANENLPATLRAAPDPTLEGIPWENRSTLTVNFGMTNGSDEVGMTAAFAGIAESGTLMLRSGPESPTTLNLLPDTHVVVLRASQIVGPYEDAWDKLRQSDLPRTVNLITGPSRTGDIEQTIYLGAHGPRRMHIVLIDDSDVE